MTTPLLAIPADVELRLVDPARNAFRIYGLTSCRDLFGQPCLRIQWGRLGSRRIRERCETFDRVEALEQRRNELLVRRRRHGYQAASEVPQTVAPRTRAPRAPLPTALPLQPSERSAVLTRMAVHRDILEAHGLPLDARGVRQLVARWRTATEALASYLEERRAEHLDLVDVSTLAAMYVEALAS